MSYAARAGTTQFHFPADDDDDDDDPSVDACQPDPSSGGRWNREAHVCLRTTNVFTTIPHNRERESSQVAVVAVVVKTGISLC